MHRCLFFVILLAASTANAQTITVTNGNAPAPQVLEVWNGTAWAAATVYDFGGTWSADYNGGSAVHEGNVYSRVDEDDEKIAVWRGVPGEGLYHLTLGFTWLDGGASWIARDGTWTIMGSSSTPTGYAEGTEVPGYLDAGWDGNLFTLVAYIASDFNAAMSLVLVGAAGLVLFGSLIFIMMRLLKKAAHH